MKIYRQLSLLQNLLHAEKLALFHVDLDFGMQAEEAVFHHHAVVARGQELVPDGRIAFENELTRLVERRLHDWRGGEVNRARRQRS